jgi:hypothetical protein
MRRWTLRAVLGLIVVAVVVVGGTAFRVWQYGRVDDRNHADVILVLGAAQYNGDPSSVLARSADASHATATPKPRRATGT